ncbi:reverse transcriptase [Plakobranchus ocellatus]|uniref:Reverse transcriptase n=1 Tax=Plakobranchus ocellatus TaxID=259542 RepID=A0AAV4BCK1_9GAST|nr:reverse transcriptase [Plakobranchus ocellatus]
MKIDEIRLEEDSKRIQKAVQQSQQGHWTSWESALQRSLIWNEIWHMASHDPTCSLRQGKQTCLSYCNVALSQGRYAWRHNRVLQELAIEI